MSGHRSRYQTGGVQERERADGETRRAIQKLALRGNGGVVGRKKVTDAVTWLEARLHEQPAIQLAPGKLTAGHEARVSIEPRYARQHQPSKPDSVNPESRYFRRCCARCWPASAIPHRQAAITRSKAQRFLARGRSSISSPFICTSKNRRKFWPSKASSLSSPV